MKDRNNHRISDSLYDHIEDLGCFVEKGLVAHLRRPPAKGFLFGWMAHAFRIAPKRCITGTIFVIFLFAFIISPLRTIAVDGIEDGMGTSSWIRTDEYNPKVGEVEYLYPGSDKTYDDSYAAPLKSKPQPPEPESYIVENPQTNEEVVWNFLLLNGFTEIQAAGVMGNLQQEHNFRTSDNGNTLGIAQWTGGRRSQLIGWGNSQSLGTQLEFMLHELTSNYWRAKNALLSSTSVEAATLAFQNHYERPGNPNTARRIAYAQNIYYKYVTDRTQKPVWTPPEEE
jgi:hypothetical protein